MAAEEQVQARVTVVHLDYVEDRCIASTATVVFSTDNSAEWFMSSETRASGKVRLRPNAATKYIENLQECIAEAIAMDSDADHVDLLNSSRTIVVIDRPGASKAAFALSNRHLFRAFSSNVLIPEVCNDMLRFRDGKDPIFLEFTTGHLPDPTAGFGFDTKSR